MLQELGVVYYEGYENSGHPYLSKLRKLKNFYEKEMCLVFFS